MLYLYFSLHCNVLLQYAVVCNVTNGEGAVVKERECLGRCGSRGHHISYGGENLTAYFCRPRGFTHDDDDNDNDDDDDWWPFVDDDDDEEDYDNDWWNFGDDDNDNNDHTTPIPKSGSDGDSELPFSGEMGPDIPDEPWKLNFGQAATWTNWQMFCWGIF